jgi:hypothetical protein
MIIRRIVSSCVTAVLLASSIASAQTVTDFPTSQTQSDQTYTPSAIDNLIKQYMDSLRDSDSQDDHTYTPSASENILTHEQYIDSLRRLNTQDDHTYRVMHIITYPFTIREGWYPPRFLNLRPMVTIPRRHLSRSVVSLFSARIVYHRGSHHLLQTSIRALEEW